MRHTMKEQSINPEVGVTVPTGRAAVKSWSMARNKGMEKIDQEHAMDMFRVTRAIVLDGNGITGKSVKARGERIGVNSNLSSRLKVAFDVATSVAKRHGGKPDANVFAAVLTVSMNSNGVDVRRESETIGANTVSAVRTKLAPLVTADGQKRKERKARMTRGDITDATKVSKASDGTTGNAHGGSGDDSAAKNGDKGDVKPPLSTEVRRVTRLVSDASESGEIDSSAWKALEALTTVLQAAKAKAKVAKATPAKVKVAAGK